MKIKKTNIFTFIISLASSVVGILLNFILARLLKADNFGTIQFYVALITTITNFTVFGINSFLIKEANNPDRSRTFLSDCLLLYMFIFCFAFPIVFYIVNNYLVFYESYSLIIIGASFLMGIVIIISSYLHGRGRYDLYVAFQTLIPKTFVLIVTLLFFFFISKTFAIDAYVYLYLVVYGVIGIVLFSKYFKKGKILFNGGDLKTIAFFFGTTVTYSLSSNLTKVLQGGLFSDSSVLGIMSISLSIINLINVFTETITNIIKPIYAQYKRTNNIEELLDLYRFNTRLTFFVALPFYAFFIFHSKNILFLFGETYTQYPLILTLLSLQSLVSCITGPNGTMLAMIGKEKWELFNGLIYFATYAIFVFVFQNEKIYGLCYALLFAEFVVNVLKYIEVCILFKQNALNLKTFLSMLICLVVNFVAVFAIKLISSFYIWLLCSLLLGIVLLITNLFLFPVGRKDVKKLIEIRL